MPYNNWGVIRQPQFTGAGSFGFMTHKATDMWGCFMTTAPCQCYTSDVLDPTPSPFLSSQICGEQGRPRLRSKLPKQKELHSDQNSLKDAFEFNERSSGCINHWQQILPLKPKDILLLDIVGSRIGPLKPARQRRQCSGHQQDQAHSD